MKTAARVGNFIRYAWMRVNWRVGFAFTVYLAAPRLGLEPTQAIVVREAAVSVMVVSFLAWANHNGKRGTNGERGSGIVGTRPGDKP